MSGKVWLVGAGPSDIGLLTIKGKKLIEQADVVVYDALVSQEILGLIPDSAETVDVGKRAGNHKMLQEEINILLLSLAQQGKKVVRLKGGDPFLFGRGGEELELLARHGISFEIVPGVTSAIAVPTYGGIPVTHREMASSLHIITAHRKKGEPPAINFRALTEAGGTLVFLMGTAALSFIMEGLLLAGMNPDTPAAILQQGTTSRQKKVIATIASLEEKVKGQDIEPPTVIVVGAVAELGKDFAWYEKLPLYGKRFMSTRLRERNKELTEKLRELGAEVIERPTISIQGIHPNSVLRKELEHLPEYRFLVFTSPAGVEEFMKELLSAGIDVRCLNGISIAVIGSGTKKALLQYGILADIMPEVYNGEELGKAIAERCHTGDRVLIARSSIGNPAVVREIRREKDIMVKDIAVYETGIVKKRDTADGKGDVYANIKDIKGIIDIEDINCIEEMEDIKDIDGVIFTSASTVRGFVQMYRGADFSRVQALCIGEMTAGEARKQGMQVSVSAEASVEGLVQLILSQNLESFRK